MSLLLDSLRRPRRDRPAADHVERTVRADAVLETLGYRRKPSPGLARPIVLAAVGIVVAGLVAWWLWPVETPRSGRQSAASPAAPVKAPPAAIRAAPDAAPEPQANRRLPPQPSPATAPASTPRTMPAPRIAAASKPPASPSAAARGEMSSAELFKLSLYHHRAGDFAAAEANYRALLARSENDAQVHNNLGLLYRDKGLTNEAVRELQRALIINPQYSTARNNLGVVLMGAARLDEAATEFRRVLAQDPRDIDARVNLALVEKAAGRPDQARESLLRALTLNPRSAPAHFNLAALYEQSGEAARAVEHYRSFLEYAGAEHAARIPDARARIAGLDRPH